MNRELALYAVRIAAGEPIDVWDGFVLQSLARVSQASHGAREAAVQALAEVIRTEPEPEEVVS